MADNVVVMYVGPLVEKGPVDAIFHDAKHPYTQALLRSIPSIESTRRVELPTITGAIPHPYNRPAGCPFHPRCPSFMVGYCDQREPGVVAVGNAFLSTEEVVYIAAKVVASHDHSLEFHTFYHPYSSEYVKRLNEGGLAGLMASDTSLPSDNGATFGTYVPNFPSGYVHQPADIDSATRTYYKENVCFDPHGANSLYNWELFFHAPLYIATRLSKNGRYEEAMKWFHYIFDPTTDELPAAGASETSRYWKVLPFKWPVESLEEWLRNLAPNSDPNTENAIIGEWRDHPFDAHVVAANWPIGYMKSVVIKYVENLIAWGDSLFRQFTRENVYEEEQLYVIANHILGPRPEFVPRRGEIKTESYDSLKRLL